ncbi:MAG TPA: response regulator [Caulobacteraceae bacterium]|jgi:CheY-like chemotaxis protein
MCHVLIIEDDAIAAIDIKETLQSAGATSFAFATTEREAIDCAREERPALITCDVMLACGFGPSAVHTIEAALGPLPVIFITATPDQCGDCDPHPVLEKPFNTNVLASLFREAAHV